MHAFFPMRPNLCGASGLAEEMQKEREHIPVILMLARSFCYSLQWIWVATSYEHPNIKNIITSNFKVKMWGEKELEVKRKLRCYKEVINPNL